MIIKTFQKEQRLYEANKRKIQSAFVPVNHNSVYHGGIIGKGLKVPPTPSPFTKVIILNPSFLR